MARTVGTDDRWLRRYQRADPGAPTLVCLPHAGGSATFFFPVARALAPRCEVVAVQYPGRQDRFGEPLPGSLDELVEQVFPVLRRAVGGPVAFFGHSMGASVAFELARRFERAGTVPVALFVSGRPAPSRHRTGGTVHLATDDELIAHLRSLSGTGVGASGHEELLRLALPAVRSDYRAAETYRYRPGPGLSCPVQVFTGDRDDMVTDAEARAWGDHTSGAFGHLRLPGGHFALVEHQAEVLAAVAGRLTAP
ncbi:alpha/beta fold hydrolase [Kitasatospora sp. NPDC047058]|uniref:thioesterase II family protein n=1 Tax=Kitasatospora sp. NPDC047058 TaxID=3155620 RepID=UPI003408D8AC